MQKLPRILFVFLFTATPALPVAAQEAPRLSLLSTFETNVFDEGAAEIAAYDADTNRLFFVNADANEVVALDLSDPAAPAEAARLSLADLGADPNGSANTVAAEDEQAPGQVVFFDSATFGETTLEAVTVGALPDGILFTPDGSTLIVAGEGEPSEDYTVDPEGTISLIDAARFTETRLGFTDFNEGGLRAGEVSEEIRIFGPGASVAQDLEPEYVAVSPDGATAYVTLQENNALAVVDLAAQRISTLVPLGFKEHRAAGHGFDASGDDGAINIQAWPVRGMYQPDAIAAFETGGQTYLITANEGDGRDYDAFSEEADVEDLTLDPTAYPDAATLQLEENLGALTSTTATGDTDGDGDIDQIYAFGGRSFSIHAADGARLYDSGDALEQITAEQLPDDFNANNDENDSFDSRSDNKGPEPEAVTTGVVDGRTYAFIGLERIGGVAVYDVTEPAAPALVEYANNRDFSVEDAEASVLGDGAVGDLGPESIVFIPAADNASGQTLVAVANEVSGTVSVFQFGEGADATPPVCGPIEIERTDGGALAAVRTSATDAESGIASVAFTTLRNLDGFAGGRGPFAEGDTYATPDPNPETVQIRGARIDVEAGGAILTTVANGAGLTALCDPVVEQIDAAVPQRFALEGNVPNPFSGQTTIQFSLAEPVGATLAVYDVLGRRVATLLDGQKLEARSYHVKWNGRDPSGRTLAPGVYVIRLHAGAFHASTRAVLVR